MRLPTGVSADAMSEALLNPRRITTRVEILTAEHKAVSEITSSSLQGQVNWLGRGAEVSRTATLDVYDPDHDLNLDSDSPNDGAVYADRFVRVTQIIDAPNLTGPAEVPVITGPIVAFKRDGVVVSLEIQGKEQRARTDVPHLVCRKGMLVVDAIEKIMRQRCGETKFSFPTNNKRKLRKDVVVGRHESKQPWKVCQGLADDIGKQLFYDGAGVLVLREPPEAVSHTFTPVAPVSKSHDWSQVFNRVEVRFGRKNKNKTKTTKDDTIKGQVALTLDDIGKKPHPFGPKRMGREIPDGDGGTKIVRWTRTQVVEGKHINFKHEASDVARKKLKRMAKQSLDIQGRVVPAWHLDPRDTVKLDGDKFEFAEAAAPFGGEGEMTVGYIDVVKKPRR